jgi:hypothetical protein
MFKTGLVPQLTKSMLHSLWKANSFQPHKFSAMWNPKVHCKVHKSPPMVPILIKANQVHHFPIYISKINLTLSSHLYPGLPYALFPSRFPSKMLKAFLISIMRPTHPAQFISPYFITLIIMTKGTKCESLHYAVLKILLLVPPYYIQI